MFNKPDFLMYSMRIEILMVPFSMFSFSMILSTLFFNFFLLFRVFVSKRLVVDSCLVNTFSTVFESLSLDEPFLYVLMFSLLVSLLAKNSLMKLANAPSRSFKSSYLPTSEMVPLSNMMI
jgi:hypothetical protein